MMVTMGTQARRAPAQQNGPAVASRTPGLLLGPYYPLASSRGTGAELWSDDSPLPAGARPLRLQGKVIDLQGRPSEGALVEIWHADHNGRYRHPSAPGQEHVAAGFAGYGRTHCDAQGRFAFRSLAPGGYAAGDAWRAPHVHVQVTGRSDRLVTQMFLPSHPLNDQDRWYGAVARPELLTPDVVHDDADTLALAWTIVLAQG